MWSREGRELVSIVDKIFLDISSFYIKSVQLYGEYYFVLDYNSGVHVLRVEEMGRFRRTGIIIFEFY